MQFSALAFCFYSNLLLIQGLSVQDRRIAVIGGGASGIFAAIAAADQQVARVTVFEGTPKTLTKVAISGGGRCNVMHEHTTKPLSEILSSYPRGSKELTGLLTKRFPPSQIYEWFTSRGVKLKTEADGRMFPVTDSSQTIIDTLLGAAENVDVQTRQQVVKIERDANNGTFQIQTKQNDSPQTFDAVILATGSSPSGHELAQSLGLRLVSPVPSLFTLSTKQQVQEGGLLYGLSGLSVPTAQLTFRVAAPGRKKKKVLQQEGPLLITHHGVSGPAALRLSAFGAREFHDVHYQGDVLVHWAPSLGTTDEIAESLWIMTSISPKRAVATSCPLMLSTTGSSAIPKRLWASFCDHVGFSKDTTWAEAPKKKVRALACMISECELHVTGRGVFKEEFVTAGGVSLKDIDMRTMESRSCPGLFLCGEVIDVDGVTGGFNFMACWSTGFVAGASAAEHIRALDRACEMRS